MTIPAGRVGTKIKAVLTLIHRGGYNVATVEQQAENAARRGQPAASAYEGAVGQFLRGTPAMRPMVERIAKLIDASDAATIAKYDAAINAYVATRDEAAINALEPMMRADLTALAVRSGEISVEDAGAGKVDWSALGMPGMSASGDPSEGSIVPVAAAPQQFAFATTPAPQGVQQEGRLAPSHPFANQPSATSSPTGVRTTATQARWDATLLPTTSKPSPYAGMSPGQIKDAFAAQAAQPRGWVDRPSE